MPAMTTDSFTVTESAMRPASDKRQCFYCGQPIGGNHKPDCVLIKKRVKVRMTIEYFIEVPGSWDKDSVEFHRNEGSWCSQNAIEELQELVDSGDCLCDRMEYEALGGDSNQFLSED